MPAGPQALLASSNPHKLAELRAALPEWLIDLLPRDDYPAETGATYAENAASKARFGKLHAPAPTWVLGEDSGIEVDALGGRPGVESARWAADGVAALLAALDGVTGRGARYVCTIVAVAPDGTELEAVGTLTGSVLDGAPRGREGFGYDPIFVPDGETLTVAELGDGWKRLHSHRARAAAALTVGLSPDRASPGPGVW